MTDTDRLRVPGPQAAGPRAAVLEAVRAGKRPVVCRGCGAVAHAGAVAGRAPCLERAACPGPEAGTGFTIDTAEITFRGLCPRCRRAGDRLPAP